ncbi:hypothetical protein C1H46_026711 [Malus baccata]|uniref:Putative plant transposon protein domain-containing protein n=1 Tax=Malus baccata TaxID=106549 RepID=A0A540LMI9_MALBA|nr:hypothetical protein C1H46_026711 [Malus baccata]
MGRQADEDVGGIGDRFKDAEALNRYKKNFRLCFLRTDRQEYLLSDFEDFGIPSVFEPRGWLSVVGPAEPANVQIIQEFYSNIPPLPADRPFPDSFDVYLRGKTLNFSVNSIARLRKLPRLKPDEPGFDYDQLVAKLDMNLVRSTLVGPYKRLQELFSVTRLTDFYKILNCIVVDNIDTLGFSSSSFITPDRARLLYAIGTNLPIDLPTYIFRVICRSASFTLGDLPFGSLITRFAMDSQVRIDPTDRLRCSSVPALKLDCIPYIKRRVPSFPAFNPAGARAPAPVPPVNNMMLHGKSVPSSPIVNAAPAASEPTPQHNQPPIVRHDRTQLSVAELRGGVANDLPMIRSRGETLFEGRTEAIDEYRMVPVG